jgi:hypothetical protein
MRGGVELTWAGGEHLFLLTIELMRALQDRCDAGPAWILARLGSGQWRVDDVVSTIRFGLEGGGMAKEEARRLVRVHVEEQPLTLSVMLAQGILMSALYGTEDDPVGEQKAGADKPTRTRSQEESGGSPVSINGQESSTGTSAK